MRTHRLVLLFAGCCLFPGCDRGPSSSDYAEWEVRQRRVDRQLDDYDRQMERGDSIQDKLQEQNRRFDKVLDKWEEQAKRMDAILEKMEREHGLKR